MTSERTLAAAIWPAGDPVQANVRAVLLVLAGSFVVAVSAQLQVPMYPVPMTMQSFAVLVIGATYGARLGAATLLLYGVEGALGLPVFAGMKGGAGHLAGPTGGYIVGFVLAAWVVGWLAEKGWDRNIGRAALAMAIGKVFIFVPGVAWLAVLFGIDKALVAGFIPFIPGLFLKIALAVVVLPGTWHLIRHKRYWARTDRG